VPTSFSTCTISTVRWRASILFRCDISATKARWSAFSVSLPKGLRQ
jgi:hypothetical protein